MAQYGRIRYDLFFKRIFSKPHIVKAFLNTVLEAELKSPIATVSFEPADFLAPGKNSLINEVKHNVIDVFCIDNEGRRILIEIQKGSDKLDLRRFLDYQCRNYSNQFKSGSNYTNVVPCYSICWLFDMKPPHPELMETITLCSDQEKSDWKFEWKIKALYPSNIRWEELKQRVAQKLEEWLLLDVIKDSIQADQIKQIIKDPAIDEAFEDLDISGYTDQQLKEVEFEEIRLEYSDQLERIKNEARQEALEKAEKEKQEALEKAEKEKQEAMEKTEKEKLEALEKAEKEKQEALEKAEKEKEAAMLMLAESLLDVLDVDTISRKTGLPVELIKKLRKK